MGREGERCMTTDRQGPRVIVTGGSGGIGAAIVDRFVDDGARVVVLDRRLRTRVDPDAAADVTDVTCDLADPADVRRAVDAAVTVLGGVDILVNCAGIFQAAPLLEITVDDWDRVFDVNARDIPHDAGGGAGHDHGRQGRHHQHREHGRQARGRR